MVDRSQIRPHMDVIDSAGERIGRVDDVDATGIKLTKDGSPDGKHHYVDLADVARVDEHVHLSRTRASLFGAGTSAAAGRAGAAAGAGLAGNRLLWLILGGLALLALIIALSQCDGDDDRAGVRDDRAAAGIVTPRVAGAPLRDGSLAFELDRFLSSEDGLPRTFTFDEVNFDSGTANLREADRADLDDIARVFAAYPEARAAIVGFADSRGNSAFNRDLGANRAKAVVVALASRGVPAGRLEARTGGEEEPVATNASPGGRFENRRTELIILKR